MPHTRAIPRLLCGLVLASVLGGCVEDVEIRVASLAFEGNDHATDAQLRAILATKAGSRLPWSRKSPFDQAVFDADLNRLRRFYQDRGFPAARIESLQVEFNPARDAVALRVKIAEGAPLIVGGLTLTGFDVLDPATLDGLDQGAVTLGQPRDRAGVASLRQRAAQLLRDNGFAYAQVQVTEAPGPDERVQITLLASPGPVTVFGPVTIAGLAALDDAVVRRQLSVREGELYRESRVIQSQRRLGTLEVLRFANIDARPPVEGQPRAVPVKVTVAEDRLRKLQLRGGYGTEDRARGSAEWSHLNFFGEARRASIEGRFSSIDRGARVSLFQPYLFRPGLAFEASGSNWWTGEPIYTSATYGGRAGITYRPRRAGRGGGRGTGDTIRVAFIYEFLRYSVRPDVQADLSNVEQLIALGLDPVTGSGRGTRTALSVSYARSAVDNLADPHAGYGTSAEMQIASPAFGGTFRYREFMGEGRAYVPIGPTVAAVRARAGTIVARSDADLPFSERYFLGGSTSLRGWGRYQVAPLSDGVPIGGRTMVETSVEWRTPLRGPIGLVTFVDVGNVWAGSLATRGGLRSDAGLGLRYRSPIGVVRGDAALQLTPIADLLVSGAIEPRPWRLHVSIGQSF